MEVYGSGPTTNVIFMSSLLGGDGEIPSHKCDWRCSNERVCGNMYLCKLTGITHICDKNCNQRILYDNHSSLCRVSGMVFPLTSTEEQAVRGVRRKLEVDSSPDNTNNSSCAFKRRRSTQFHPSPFERSFQAVSPICSQIGGDGMDMREAYGESIVRKQCHSRLSKAPRTSGCVIYAIFKMPRVANEYGKMHSSTSGNDNGGG